MYWVLVFCILCGSSPADKPRLIKKLAMPSQEACQLIVNANPAENLICAQESAR